MTDPGACAHCGRFGVLWGRTDEGRICRRCVAIRSSGTCGHCGDHRRIAGRDPDGLAWCRSCKNRHRRDAEDVERRRLVVTAVITANSTLTAPVVEDVLSATVGSRRSLRLLAEHVAAHPDAFTNGPTSTLAVLERFTTLLIAAGAASITMIHPSCAGCGQRRRWHARLGDDTGQCSTCWARTNREPCTTCGRRRRVDHRDEHGQPECFRCTEAHRRRARLDELADEITVLVDDTDIFSATIAAIADRVEPNIPGRAKLADALRRGPALTVATHRPPRVARLLDELRAAGSRLPAGRCEDCGDPAEPLVVYRDVVRCHTCAKRCPECGGTSKEPTKPRCGRCERRPRGVCGDCGRADRPLDDHARCRGCRERAERRCEDCGDQAPRTWHTGRWRCQRCALGADLDHHLGAALRLPQGLAAVRAAIAAADNPTQVRKWVRTTTGGRLLAELAAGTVELNHDALDAHGADRSVAHLRALLVAAGALPAEDRSVNRLDAFAAGLLHGVGDRQDAKVLRAWLRWQVLPRLRARHDAGASMAHSANNARRALRQVVAFLDSLHSEGRALRTCTQADLDSWFVRPGALPWLARPFLAWAADRKHLARPLTIPSTPPQAQRPVIDDETRWAIARRLVVDDSLDITDRVTAALVVLYGQPLARIAALQTTDIHRSPDGTVLVELDGNPVPIHEPFATLIGQLPRRHSNGVSDQLASAWLFPGRHAGRHIGPVVLGERLRNLGIEPRAMRNAARAQLAAEIPPALLGEVIGVAATTATRWAALTAGNWTAYAADLA